MTSAKTTMHHTGTDIAQQTTELSRSGRISAGATAIIATGADVLDSWLKSLEICPKPRPGKCGFWYSPHSFRLKRTVISESRMIYQTRPSLRIAMASPLWRICRSAQQRGKNCGQEPAGQTLFTFAYNDTLPWPLKTDGEGHTIEWKYGASAGDPEGPANWRASVKIHGSPGAGESALPADFLLFYDYLTEPIRGKAMALAKELTALPDRLHLEQNYPNPFNSSTMLRYQIVEAGEVRLDIYNLAGQHVKTWRHAVHKPGVYVRTWDGRDERGRPVSSGLYLARLQASGMTQARKMALLK